MSDAWILILGSYSGAPAKNANLPSILVSFQGINTLLDCGEGCQIRLIEHGIGPSRIDAIAITHLHGDHIFGLPGLLQSMGLACRSRELVIKGPAELQEFINASFKITRYKPPFKIIYEHPLRETIIAKSQKLVIKGFRTFHAEVESYGYVLEGYRRVRGGWRLRFKVAYTGDTAPSREYISFIRNSDVLIHDATFEEGMEDSALEYGHSTARDAALIAREAGVKMLILFHKSTRYAGKNGLLEKQARRFFENSFEAYDGMKIIL